MFYFTEFNASASESEAEVYCPIDGFDDYEVSNLGRVRSYKTGQPVILANTLSTSGYLQVTLRRDRTKSTHYVHRLVAAAWMGPCPEGLEVCHNNGMRTDSDLRNLRYDTRQANSADRHLHGTHIQRQPFTEVEVRGILEGAARGETVLSQADQMGVGPYRIADVRSGKTYSYFATDLKRGFKRTKN